MHPAPQKVAFYTLGCKLNYSETSTLGRLLQNSGFEKVEFHEPADVYVINTCSVTDNADKKCRKIVREALKHAPNAYIIVLGCYAQLKPEEISNIPGVDLVLGAAEKFNIAQHLQNITKKEKGTYISGSISAVNVFNPAYSVGERTRSFLKVQDGCDYKCAFCTIPLARGQSRSSSINQVIQQAHEIVQLGVKEIVLTGVNIGDYGKNMNSQADTLDEQHLKTTFFDLIQQLEKIPIPRIRISSIEPNLLTPQIIDFVATSQRFMPHFHVPLQSGNDQVLKDMRRRYQRQLYAQRTQLIKQAMPHACIGADVIVGFPTETHQHFLDTYQFLNDLDLSYLHVFTYSERPNTHALTLNATVPPHQRHERSTMLHTLSDKKRRFFYEQHLHTTRPVLWEAENNGNLMHGFTDNYIKVQQPYDPIATNEINNNYLAHLNPDNTINAETVFVPNLNTTLHK